MWEHEVSRDSAQRCWFSMKTPGKFSAKINTRSFILHGDVFAKRWRSKSQRSAIDQLVPNR
jgi:hypothetical protein